jgi:hypothetical protein
VPATTLRVIRDGPVAVWEARTANGWTVVAAGPQRGGGYAITTNCVLGPSARVIRLCMRGADEAWGRVAPGVARVVVRRAGVRPREATVRNGWFLARVAGPGGATLQAVDASGRVLRAVRY